MAITVLWLEQRASELHLTVRVYLVESEAEVEMLLNDELSTSDEEAKPEPSQYFVPLNHEYTQLPVQPLPPEGLAVNAIEAGRLLGQTAYMPAISLAFAVTEGGLQRVEVENFHTGQPVGEPPEFFGTIFQ
jgi:hypothetical protein